MGASQSTVKSVTDIVQEATKDVVMANSAQCSASSGMSQTMRIRGLKAGRNCAIDISKMGQKLKLEVNLNCVQNQGNSADLQTKFESKLDEKIKNESEAGLGLSNATVEQKKAMSQKIKTNVKMSNVASCLASTFGKQEILIEDLETGDCPDPITLAIANLLGMNVKSGITVKDIQQDAVVKTTAKCVQDQLNKLGDVNSMVSDVKSDTSSSAKGMDPMALFGGIAIMLIAAALLVGIAKGMIPKPPTKVMAGLVVAVIVGLVVGGAYYHMNKKQS